jgi:uncharacterized protein YlzI (FlbEa/FlbD family)
MRNFTRLMLLGTMLFMYLGGAKSQDYQIYERKTSVAAGDVVAIVNETDGTGKAFYGSGSNNLAYDVYTNAFKSTNAAICFKLEAVTGGFLLRAMTPGGDEYSVYGGPGYLNSQEADAGKWCCFIQGLNGQNGQDIVNGAVWDIQYSSTDGGFSIKNVGTNKYLKDAKPAEYGEATYFTLCTIISSDYELSANHVLNVTNPTAGDYVYSRSTTYTLPSSMIAGKTYVIQADIKAVNGGQVDLCCKTVSNADGTAKYPGSKGVLKNEFTRVSWEFTPVAYEPADLYNQVDLQFFRIEGEIYIDNLSCKEKTSSTELVANGDFEIPNSVDGWIIPGWTGQSIQQTELALGTVETNATAICTVGASGFRTFITGERIVVDEDDAKVYIAKYVKPSVILTPCSIVPSWTPVIVEASAGDHVFRTTTDAPDDCSANELQLKWSATPTDGTFYALGVKSSVVGFYKVATGQSVPSGKAYLVITDPPTAAREFIGFSFADDETTGITNNKREPITNNQFFDLQGRKIANSAKGLYIVNGKKIIVK